MIDLLVATTNAGKLAEVRAFLQNLPLKIVTLEDLLTWPKVIEDGRSFEENALKKARTLCEYSGYYTLADDSGLEVDALNGAPGIYSARYAGEGASDEANLRKLLATLQAMPSASRTCRSGASRCRSVTSESFWPSSVSNWRRHPADRCWRWDAGRDG